MPDSTVIVTAIAPLAMAVSSIATVRWLNRKTRAETRGVLTTAAVAADAQTVASWRDLVTTQTEAIVGPLQRDVDNLRAEVKELRTEVEHRRDMYWQVVKYTRALAAAAAALYAQIRTGGQTPVTDIPDPPSSIADDL